MDQEERVTVLLFDLGNTRLKWRLIGLRSAGADVLAEGAILWPEDIALLDQELVLVTEAVAGGSVEHVWAVSVAGRLRELELIQWSRQYLALEPQFASSSNRLAGVVNGYEQVERLGVDRWLALVGAWQKVRGPCLVVDAGSAITVDLLNAQGEHLGGYIAPGVRLMREALFRGTDAVKVPENGFAASLAPGCNTGSAVGAALAAMVVGLILRAKQSLCSQLSGEVSAKVALLLTGGDGSSLASMLAQEQSARAGCDVIVEGGLVFDGLCCWGKEQVFVR